MERFRGKPLFGLMINHILRTGSMTEFITDNIKGTARTLSSVHKIKANLIDTSYAVYERAVHYNKRITDDEKKTVLLVLDSLPKGNTICHGDPNPSNILVSGKEISLIDWMFTGTGHFMYDIAEYVIATRYLYLDPESTDKRIIIFMDKYAEEMIQIFFSEYSKITGAEITDIDKWLIPLLVNRLNGGGSEKYKQRLLTDMRTKLTAVRS